MAPPVDLADVQGNILQGYRRQFVRHLLLHVVDAAAARRWLGAAAAGGDGGGHGSPSFTSAAPWVKPGPDVCLNVGLTFDGLGALGLPAAVLDSFPEPFVAGMPARALKLGDVGDSAPSTWMEPFRVPGGARAGAPSRVHAMVSIYSDVASHVDRTQADVLGTGGAGWALAGTLDGAAFPDDLVHFGYRDNISQPRFEGIHDPALYPDQQPLAPLGTVLLGHPTALEGLAWQVPEAIGMNGAFNAFRVLAQEVAQFERFLDEAAEVVDRHPAGEHLLPLGAEAQVVPGGPRRDALREVVAAKMCGRWRNGTPLATFPGGPGPVDPSDLGPLMDFDYVDDDNGLRCPVGSHVRRANPRNARIVQRVSNHTRRLVRRGMPYGPRFDPSAPDDAERGLLGSFLCASLTAQFESVQYDWVNLGLQHPTLTGTNDPLLGANGAADSRFDIITPAGTISLYGLPRFIRTRGGAYTFLPSLSALRHIGSLDG